MAPTPTACLSAAPVHLATGPVTVELAAALELPDQAAQAEEEAEEAAALLAEVVVAAAAVALDDDDHSPQYSELELELELEDLVAAGDEEEELEDQSAQLYVQPAPVGV